MEYVLESILSLHVPQVGEQGHQILAVEHVHQTLHASHTQVHQIKKTKKLQMYLRKLCYKHIRTSMRSFLNLQKCVIAHHRCKWVCNTLSTGKLLLFYHA